MKWLENMKLAFLEIWERHKVIAIIIIIALLAGIGVAVFGAISTFKQEDALTAREREFIEDVLPNIISKKAESPGLLISKIDELMGQGKIGDIERVYYRAHPEEWNKILYYVRYKNEEGYRLYFADSNINPFPLIQALDFSVSVNWVNIHTYLHKIAPDRVFPVQASLQPPGLINRPWFPIMIVLILVVGLGFFLLFFYRNQVAGKFLEVCKKRYAGEKITFDEIAGIEEAKAELYEVINFIEKKENYQIVKAKVPKGILLIGPPGCGKTLMARAIADQIGAAFMAMSGSEFVEMFVGVGASRIRSLFEAAKKTSKKFGYCVIFIDEVDALGAKRGARVSGSDDEQYRTTNEVMVQMDGIESGQGIIVIAATNRPDILDEAFMRPGRFDRKIFVGYPDVKGREAILKVHVKGKPMAEDIDLAELAKSIPLGSSGADIANIVNEAAIYAGRRGKKQIDREDFQDARDKIRFGLEKKGEIVTEAEKRVFAYHEGGHALVAKLLPDMPPLGKVSIVRRGSTHGVVEILPEKDRNIRTRQDLLNDIIFCLASVAAEEEIFGARGVTTGAQADLEQATRTAMAMVSIYGMSKEFGLVSLKVLSESGIHSSFTKEMIEAVDKINTEAKNKAQELIKANRSKLDALAEALIRLENLDGKTAEKIIDEN